jgi:hypothetical protein
MQDVLALPHLTPEGLPKNKSATSISSSTAKMLTLMPFPSPPHADVAAAAP